MKHLVFALYVTLYSGNYCYSQVVPIEKMLNLTGKPFQVVSDYLILIGWDYRGVDTASSDQYGYNLMWAYKYNDETQLAVNWLYTYKEIKGDSVTHISEKINKSEYLRTVNVLASLNFKPTKTFAKNDGIEKVYENKLTTVELVSFFKTGAKGKEENQYQLDVLKFF